MAARHVVFVSSVRIVRRIACGLLYGLSTILALIVGRFDNIHPGLSCQNALQILKTPVGDLESQSDLYMAAAHLINCPGAKTEQALITLLGESSDHQAVKIAKRKAVETLARLESSDSIQSIGNCLWSEDPFLVENTVWALQKLQCREPRLVEKMLELLSFDVANQRVLIQYMSALDIRESIGLLPNFLESSGPGVKGAAIAALARLTGDDSRLSTLVGHLSLPNQMDRQCAVQDLIDARATKCLSDIAVAPVSPAFRLRACRLLMPDDERCLQETKFLNNVDKILVDDPFSINIVHQYDEEPALDFLIRDLFNVDFSRCYLSMRSLQGFSSDCLLPLIVKAWDDEANNDYGAHYFFMRLLGSRVNWSAPARDWIQAVLKEAAINRRPQFQKSRAIAMMSYLKLWPHQFSDFVDQCLDELVSPPWECRYVIPMIIENNQAIDAHCKKSTLERIIQDSDPFVRAKAGKVLSLLLS